MCAQYLFRLQSSYQVSSPCGVMTKEEGNFPAWPICEENVNAWWILEDNDFAWPSRRAASVLGRFERTTTSPGRAWSIWEGNRLRLVDL